MGFNCTSPRNYDGYRSNMKSRNADSLRFLILWKSDSILLCLNDVTAGLCPGQRSACWPGEDQPGVPAQVPGGGKLRELQTELQDGLLLARAKHTAESPGDGVTVKHNSIEKNIWETLSRDSGICLNVLPVFSMMKNRYKNEFRQKN